MPAPFEILAGLVDAYLAPVGTAFPIINVAPAGTWIKLGAGGSKDFTEDGLVVRHEVGVERIRSAGTTGPRKAFRTTEDLLIELTLMDATAEALQAALNQLAITTVVGPPAEKTIQLLEGQAVTLRALLIRGVLSPYADSASNLQFDVPIVYQNGPIELVFRKGEPVGLKLQFVALQDDTLGFGKLHLPTS
jgi:hypothetical protein